MMPFSKDFDSAGFAVAGTPLGSASVEASCEVFSPLGNPGVIFSGITNCIEII